MTNAAVTVKAVDFVKAATAALECASKDDTLPILQAVHLMRVGDDVILESTDRYMMVRARVDLMPDGGTETPSTGGDFSRVLIPGKALKSALQAIKALKPGNHFPLRIEVSTVDHETTWKMSVLNMWSTSGFTTDGDYPELAGLFGKEATGVGAGMFGLNSDFIARLARIGKLGGRNAPMAFSPNENPNKPIHFRVGEDIAGMIMPVRLVSGDAVAGMEMPSWATAQPIS